MTDAAYPPEPPDVTPRDAIANVVMALRDAADSIEKGAPSIVSVWELTGWATRLERAVRMLDAEKAGREAKTGSTVFLIRGDIL